MDALGSLRKTQPKRRLIVDPNRVNTLVIDRVSGSIYNLAHDEVLTITASCIWGRIRERIYDRIYGQESARTIDYLVNRC